MRIVYIADIHGAFNRVKILLAETTADVYIVSGDLIDIPFYNMNTAVNYHELQSYFHALRLKMGRESIPIEDFVDELLNRPDVSDEIEELGSRYQQYTIRARRVLQQKYKVLENVLSLKQTAAIFCLPGNYDMDLKYTALHERDLHLHWHEVQNLKIAGYGGADLWTPGVPERYVVKYRAGVGIDVKQNEMHHFFKAVKPDVIATHQPAHGIHDRVNQFGPSGSPALRGFCDANAVLLCLTGHVHADWGFQTSEGTIYLNPSNFGEVTLLTGAVSEGGFFYSIEVEDRNVRKIIFKKLVDDRIHDIADYEEAGGRWRETIVDEGRYRALKAGENYDSKIQKVSHIPEIQLYNEIKQFYRMFQTEETEERLDILEQVAKRIENRVRDDIGMDVLGSANMGQCQTGSDIDFVLYIRCGSGAKADMQMCEQYRNASRIIEETLKPKFAIQIMDCIDLDVVEKSIREKNFECEMTQRFVAYRAICRPINYRVIAPVEDLLNQDMEYRSEIEGSIRSYFQIFINTSQHTRSFDKYESRIQSVGIRLPDSIRLKVRQYLRRDGRPGEGCTAGNADAGERK